MASLQELLAQKAEIDRQISDARRTERNDAVAKVRALMAEHGLTAADLVAKAPGPRASNLMAYDDDRDRVVLLGGYTPAGYLNETWEFDGARWLQRTPATSPPPRDAGAMVYDLARGRMVLFGGSGTTLLNDTWEYDGVNWRSVQTPVSPPARYQHVMSYDRHRGRTVLFSGLGASTLQDLWEYDGSNWTAVAGPGPGAMYSAVLAYDAQRRRQVLHGGPPGMWQRQTWELLPPNAATFARCGRGCAGSAGVPTLDAVGGQLPSLGSTLGLQFGGLPLDPGFAILGVAFYPSSAVLPQPLDAAGLPGCLLWIMPAFDLLVAHNGGTATATVPIPSDLRLFGLEVGLQFASLDPGAPGGFGALSNGALLVLR